MTQRGIFNIKCDNCKHLAGYTLGPDECGSGSFFPYCRKGHWEGSGPDTEEKCNRLLSIDDQWADCKDFVAKAIMEKIERDGGK